MRALAAAMERSAEATSGRRCNRSEGSPTGMAGSGAAGAVARPAQTRAPACRPASRWHARIAPVGCARSSSCVALGIDQRLLLRQIQARRESQIVPRADEVQSVALQIQAVAHHGDFSIEFAQREIVGHQLAPSSTSRVFSKSASACCAVARAPFDVAAHAAEQVDLVVDVRARARNCSARSTGSAPHIGGSGRFAEVLPRAALPDSPTAGYRSAAGDGDLIACLVEPRGGHAQVLIAGERALDQRIQRRVLEQLPPIALERRVVRRRLMPGRLGLPGRAAPGPRDGGNPGPPRSRRRECAAATAQHSLRPARSLLTCPRVAVLGRQRHHIAVGQRVGRIQR